MPHDDPVAVLKAMMQVKLDPPAEPPKKKGKRSR